MIETKTGKSVKIERDFDVALIQDSMFQLHIARRVMRRTEMLFETTRGEKTGFVIGLDEYFIQIVSLDQKISWIQRDQIVSFSETGVILAKVKETHPDAVDRIQTLMMGFRKKCIQALSDGGLLFSKRREEEETEEDDNESEVDEGLEFLKNKVQVRVVHSN